MRAQHLDLHVEFEDPNAELQIGFELVPAHAAAALGGRRRPGAAADRLEQPLLGHQRLAGTRGQPA